MRLRNLLTSITILRLLLAVWLLLGLEAPVIAATPSPDRPDLPLAEQYRLAKEYYQELSQDPQRAATRKNWLTAARYFRQIYRADQNAEQAPASLFMLARIYRDLYRRHHNPRDLGEAIAYNEDLVALYSSHRLADDALYNLIRIYRQEQPNPEKAAKFLAQLLQDYPDGDMIATAALGLAPPEAKGVEAARSLPVSASAGSATVATPVQAGGPPADLMPLRFWSTGNYTRVVIETSAPVNFKEYLLEKSGKQPRRLYVDLYNCRVTSQIQKSLPIDDGLLRQIRSGQFTPGRVRVVLDTQSISDYKIFTLQDPFRIVIDVSGQRPAKSPAGREASPPALTLAQQLGLGIKRIIVDPGHGGKDCGAIGIGGILEKDITLAVAREVANRLRSRLECEVIMTRDSDIFIPLEERTAIANTKEGDLFISIHANAAPSPTTRGIETYILDLAKNKNAMQVAARENASSAHQLSDLQSILQDLIQNSKKSESIKLAEYVQDSMVTGLKGTFPEVRDLGVKQAPFVVLLGAQMPAILTEIAFLSNPEEADWLQSDEYQGQVADQIVNGVSGYVNDLRLAAMR